LAKVGEPAAKQTKPTCGTAGGVETPGFVPYEEGFAWR